ncbi:MAG: M28 family peptidase [Acidobacteriota bacterium]
MRFRPGVRGPSSRLVAAVLTVAAASGAALASPEGERAFRHVAALAGGIGPRKTSTEADRLAVEYVRLEMESAGLDVVLQEVPVVPGKDGERAVRSWNVIGSLDGDGPDTIIVAAHHDTRNFEVPGANDDASGLGVLLEAARHAASRRRGVRYRFISFCAEEEGLLGSRYYVAHAELSRVRAMIALELLGRGEILVGPVPGPPSQWAQELFLRSARRAGVREVAARPLWALVPRFIHLPFSADHEPFLESGVPAFLLLGTFPAWAYHTAEDRVSAVRADSLGRAVAVLERLLRELEEQPPSRVDDPHYLPLTLFGVGIIAPTIILVGIAVAALVAVGLLAIARRRSLLSPSAISELARVLIVTGACAALGLSGPFASEALMERVHGVRFPWTAHQGLHVGLAAVCALLTGWVALNIFRRIKPTIEPGPYLAGSLLLPVAGVATGLLLGRPELAAIPAAASLGFVLSLLTENTGRKLACGLLGALPLLLLGTLEDYRAAVQLGKIVIPGWILFGALLTAVLPFVLFLAHVASFRDCLHSRYWWWLSGPWIGGPALLAAIVLGVVCALLPAYDSGHRQLVQVRQRVNVDDRTAAVTVHSLDSLEGVRLDGAEGRGFGRGVRTERLDRPFPADEFVFHASVSAAPLDGERAVACTLRFAAPLRADRLSYVFTSRSGLRVPGRGPGLRDRYTITEIAPRREIAHRVRLVVPGGGDLSVTLRADFETDLLGLRPDGPSHVFVHRAAVTASRRLLDPEEGGRTSGAAHPGSSRAGGSADPLPGVN